MRVAILRPISAVLLVVMLGGCAQTGQTIANNPKATMGGMLGAAGGGLIGAARQAPAGIIGGSRIGGSSAAPFEPPRPEGQGDGCEQCAEAPESRTGQSSICNPVAETWEIHRRAPSNASGPVLPRAL
jgi:hypothetical protein